MRGEGRGVRDEGQGARDEGRGTRGEGRGARDKGRGARGEGRALSFPLPPLSFPPVSPITNVGDKVSGNPVSFSSVPSFVWPCMGMDSRLKTSGMTEGG